VVLAVAGNSMVKCNRGKYSTSSVTRKRKWKSCLKFLAYYTPTHPHTCTHTHTHTHTRSRPHTHTHTQKGILRYLSLAVSARKIFYLLSLLRNVSYLSRNTVSRGQMKCEGRSPETRFRLSAKRTSPLNRLGRQFSRLLAAELCASAVVMLDTPCSEVV
jgi:hypothetical protein